MTIEEEARELTETIQRWRGHINTMLDALGSNPQEWLRELNIPSARDAVQEFREGGWVVDYAQEQAPHFSKDLQEVLNRVLEGIRDDLDGGSVGG